MRNPRALVLVMLLLWVTLPVCTSSSVAWGNGDPASVQYPDYGIHDLTVVIALRDLQILSSEAIRWATEWYLHNTTDRGYSFDSGNTGPVVGDNFLSYTDDPDTHFEDWDNHTLILHPRTGWDPPEGDAARRVHQLYNETRDNIFGWLYYPPGTLQHIVYGHRAAYAAGIMSHYLMDVTQFGHTDWTRLDHSAPPDDPQGPTYHSHYEARVWSDSALWRLHLALMGLPLPQLERVEDPGQLVHDLAEYVNGRHGPAVRFTDVTSTEVTLGSTYVMMLENFTSNWDDEVEYHGMRGYDEDLWNLTLENLWAGIENLTLLWYSAYHDAYDIFLEEAPDIHLEGCNVTPEPQGVADEEVTVEAWLRNDGNSSGGDFDIVLFVDDEEVDSVETHLNPTESKRLELRWMAEAGTHELVVVADGHYELPESNESNNAWNATYEVLAEVHGSSLTAEPEALELLQDDQGTFNLTLENLGNMPDLFEVSIDAPPGVIDFSLTLLNDTVEVGPYGRANLSIDVKTRLENEPGRREFKLAAKGGNSTSNVSLAVVISERPLPPFVDVNYSTYGNVSVPMAFDASGSWDHNGDPITFTWDFGDGAAGEGAVVEHTYSQEGVYTILLNASDGALHRYWTLEVSVLDAIPPVPALWVEDVDINAVRLGWTPWDAPHMFSSYNIYIAGTSDPEELVRGEHLAVSIGSIGARNATLPFPWGQYSWAILGTMNTLGLAVWSEPVEIVPSLRVSVYGEGDPLANDWVNLTSVTKNSIEVRWRDWDPLLEKGFYWLFIIGIGGGMRGVHRGQNTLLVEGLSPGERYEVYVSYLADGGLWDSPSVETHTVANMPPVVEVSGATRAVVEERYALRVQFDDVDGGVDRVVVDWGDGITEELDPLEGNATAFHVFTLEGSYLVRVNAYDTDGERTTSSLQVTVEAEERGSPQDLLWPLLIALIVLIAINYYWVRRSGVKGGRPEVEEEGPKEGTGGG